MNTSNLDQAVLAAAANLAKHGVPAPDVLCWMASGVGLMPSQLEQAGKLPWTRTEGVPASWSQTVLYFGRVGQLCVWLLEPPRDMSPGEPAWASAFPVWLAAASKASVLLIVGAGTALGDLQPGTLALASDHINLSGSSPLTGLGESRLGPLFPDQSRTHDAHLRRAAQSAAARQGLDTAEVILALSAGPALETPAEQRWFQLAGAAVSTSDATAAVLAAAHAGLATLTVTAVCAKAGESTDIAKWAALAQEFAPALEDFTIAWCREVGPMWTELLAAEHEA